MSKAEVLHELETFSPEDLEEIAIRLDELRCGPVTDEERALIAERLDEYEKNPTNIVELEIAVGELLKRRK
jgi:hypothetical protein